MDENKAFSNFPVNGILPKKETGALNFLQKYPNYDGRNTLIAIFDTGVDPGAPGLQTTSEGKPKIVDLIDATGSGDVDISTVRTAANGSGELTGLSGRRLKLPSGWNNPSNRWHLGVKDLYELASSTLRDRLKKERKERLWQPANDEALFRLQGKLNELNNNSKKTAATEPVEADAGAVVSSSSQTQIELAASKDLNELSKSLYKEDLQAQLEIVKDLENKIKDIGPVYDCIVWNDGEKWRACIDTTEKGDLEKCKVLTNYKDSHEFGTFSYQDMLNYTVRILPDENILQIVTDSTSHGTHVASIAAGYFADSPELNGIAPGAQIISVKIGDNRINGMETAYAIANACRYAAEYKCDLVNYSFGEPIHYVHTGPALRAIQELVTQYGVVFCASAGNNGPGIETSSAPGGSISEVISVGAYVTVDMIKAEHSLLGQPASGMLFTWSSRGPYQDGQSGVSVCAPGGAFAAVPNWTQRGTQLMSGTSMASPNCTGCISLLLSGLKDRGVSNDQMTPYLIKRAVENTAQAVEESMGGGSGLVQVERAFDYLLAYKDSLLHRIHIDVKYSAPKSSQTYRGIYITEHDECYETRDYLITVEPKFFENLTRTVAVSDLAVGGGGASGLDITSDDDKDENLLNCLVWEDDNLTTGRNWLEYPPYFYLVNSSRQFPIRIHANELDEGKVYFTHLKAIDLEDSKLPCLFKIPITVVKPNLDKFVDIFFEHQLERLMLLTSDNKDHSPLFYVQSFTLGSFRTLADSAKEEVYRLNNTNELKHVCKVQANKVFQISIAKNWSNIGHVLANYKVKFRGLYPKNGHEVWCTSSNPCKIEVGSFLNNEDCELGINYKQHIQPLRPVEHQIEVVKPSQGLYKPVYQIVLTYHFHQSKTDEVGFESPLLSHQLYENEFQSIFWMAYETNTKRYLFSGDVFPIHYKYTKSLEKGDYTVRLFIRHEKMDLLEKLKETNLHVRRAISGTLSQDVYMSYSNLLKNSGKKTSPERIQRDAERVFYLGAIPEDKLPKGVGAGHFLEGDLTFFKDATINKVDKHRIMYQITTHGLATTKKQNSGSGGGVSNKEKTPSPSFSAAVPKSSSMEDSLSPVSSTSASSNIKTEDSKLKEAIRDVQVAHILKSNEIFESLRKEYPDHIPIYVNRIQYLNEQLSSMSTETIDKKVAIYDEIIELANVALSKINQNELFKYYGEKSHEPSVEENKKDYENQKNWVIELLVQQGIALIDRQLAILSTDKSHHNDEATSTTIRSIKLTEELRQIYRSLQKWIDLNDDKVSKFMIKFYMHQRLYGKSLKLLFKQTEEKNASKSNDQTILNILNEMNLRHAKKYFINNIIMKYPAKYANY